LENVGADPSQMDKTSDLKKIKVIVQRRIECPVFARAPKKQGECDSKIFSVLSDQKTSFLYAVAFALKGVSYRRQV